MQESHLQSKVVKVTTVNLIGGQRKSMIFEFASSMLAQNNPKHYNP
jgi:hypothetical protein